MINLHHVECMEFMKTMPDNSVDAIVTDPPYFGVKDDDWDNQWKSAAISSNGSGNCLSSGSGY
jgi:DNA modification methylase